MSEARPNNFGAWRLNRDLMVLVTTPPDQESEYQVDLEQCVNPAQTLDWIMQVASKGWATSKIVGDLVMAINTIMVPQEYLCSFGKNQTIPDPPQFLRDRFKRLDEDRREELDRKARQEEALHTGIYVAKDGSRYPCPRPGELPLEAYAIEF
jgi:hypothetical protein